MNKINFLKIVTDHLQTLTVRGNGGPVFSKADLCIFYIVPLLGSIVVLICGVRLQESVLGILLSAFAILTGLLFNLLVLIFDLIGNEKKAGQHVASAVDRENKAKLLKEVFVNVSYSIFVGITLSCLCVVAIFVKGYCQTALNGIIYFGGFSFALTLLMILKRIHTLLMDQFERVLRDSE